jgi:putative acetyltransferase
MMTPLDLTIRNETSADIPAIFDLTARAFETLEISGHTEQYILDALRDAGVLSVSLVAVLENRLVGHIAFSPITLSDGTTGWYGLGPVSVLPEFQRTGIGGALIRAGLDRLKALGAAGCCLVGHPDYYPRFGFIHPPALSHEGVPPEAFFALSFDGRYPIGTVTFHEAFMVTGSDR